MKKGLLIALVIFLVAFPMVVGAQGGINPIQPSADSSLIKRTLDNLVGWAFGFLIFLAGVFVLWAAYLYLMAGGNEDNIGKAKTYIIYAIIAVIVAFLSRAVIQLVVETVF
ncbi:MAG: hypothetical protein AAB407_01540 [Patescibacteria group bacterium]